MITLPKQLELALNADDADRMNRIIAEANPDHFELLEVLVRDAETPMNYRRRALSALGRWPGRGAEAAAIIAAVLPGLNELERIAAVNALGRVGSEAALEPVLACTADESPDVRLQAARALNQIGTNRALGALDDMATHDGVDYVRDRARRLRRRHPHG
jgi:HEAT repeat protein